MAHKTNIPYISSSNMLLYLDKLAEVLNNRYGQSCISYNVLITGGSALALKYNFRATVDIDADITFSREINSSIKEVARIFNLYDDWINQDVVKSESYSRRLWNDCRFVNTLRGSMNIYVVSDLSQLCMKINAGRDKDRNDALFLAQACINSGIRFRDVIDRYKFLYGKSVKQNRRVYGVIKRKFMLNGML